MGLGSGLGIESGGGGCGEGVHLGIGVEAEIRVQRVRGGAAAGGIEGGLQAVSNRYILRATMHPGFCLLFCCKVTLHAS